jgi:hypothetical protein
MSIARHGHSDGVEPRVPATQRPTVAERRKISVEAGFARRLRPTHQRLGARSLANPVDSCHGCGTSRPDEHWPRT